MSFSGFAAPAPISQRPVEQDHEQQPEQDRAGVDAVTKYQVSEGDGGDVGAGQRREHQPRAGEEHGHVEASGCRVARVGRGGRKKAAVASSRLALATR